MRPSRAGIVKDRTGSAELRGNTGLPNDAGFIFAFSDWLLAVRFQVSSFMY